MDDDIKELFQKYNENYKNYEELMQGDLPRSLKLFNIRLRLAIDIQIDFKSEVSLTKDPIIKNTYILLIKMMESWNAYEALIHYTKDAEGYVSQVIVNINIYTSFLMKFERIQLYLQRLKMHS